MVEPLAVLCAFYAASAASAAKREYVRGPGDLNLPSGRRAPGEGYRRPFHDAHVQRSLFFSSPTPAPCVPSESSSSFTTFSLLKYRNSNIESTIYKTPNFDPANYNASIQAFKLVEQLLGSYDHMRIFFLEPGNSDDSVYQDVLVNWCSWADYGDGYSCASREIEDAKAGSGNWYVSGTTKCICSKRSNNNLGMFMSPPPSTSQASSAARAVHEMIHIYQAAAGGFPAWMMEGNAVLAECMFAETLYNMSSSLSDFSSYHECFRNGGGGGGILSQAYDLFKDQPDVFATKGEDRDKYDDGTLGSTSRALYYDAGAMAIMFAAQKASKSTVEFVQEFYKLVEPAPKGWENLSDEQGWKKAFLTWSGFGSMAEFYSEFKTFMLSPSSGTGDATTYAQEAALESNAAHATAMRTGLADSAYATPPPLDGAAMASSVAVANNSGQWPFVARSPPLCTKAPGPAPTTSSGGSDAQGEGDDEAGAGGGDGGGDGGDVVMIGVGAGCGVLGLAATALILRARKKGLATKQPDAVAEDSGKDDASSGIFSQRNPSFSGASSGAAVELSATKGDDGSRDVI